MFLVNCWWTWCCLIISKILIRENLLTMKLVVCIKIVDPKVCNLTISVSDMEKWWYSFTLTNSILHRLLYCVLLTMRSGVNLDAREVEYLCDGIIYSTTDCSTMSKIGGIRKCNHSNSVSMINLMLMTFRNTCSLVGWNLGPLFIRAQSIISLYIL